MNSPGFLTFGMMVCLVVAGIAALNRDPLSLWFALNVPRFFGNPIEQTLGVARTSDGVGIAYATTGQGPAIVFVLGWATHIEGGFGKWKEAGGPVEAFQPKPKG